MAKRIPALVESSVLVWARESAGYSVQDIASRFGKSPDEIEAWETGAKHLYMGQLRNLADFYKRPISDFYLPTPPKEKPLPHDFRRSPGKVSGHYTPALRMQLRLARERQDIIKYLHEDMGGLPPKFSHHAKSSQPPEVVGEYARKILGIVFKNQRQWNEPYATLRGWRKRIEAQNILVFQFENVEVKEAWGFSIVDPIYPVIGINKKLAPNGRTFTMLHEFTHLLLNKSSICDIDDYTSRASADIAIEVFCNHVAAASLMPEKEFKANETVRYHKDASTDWTDQDIKAISLAFGVSREAAIRRLLTFELTTPAFYREQRAKLHAQFTRQKIQEREKRRAQKKSFSGQSRAQRAVTDFGGNFVRAVLGSLGEKRITLADAAQYLQVRPPAISKVQDLLLQG